MAEGGGDGFGDFDEAEVHFKSKQLYEIKIPGRIIKYMKKLHSKLKFSIER